MVSLANLKMNILFFFIFHFVIHLYHLKTYILVKLLIYLDNFNFNLIN